MTYLELVNRVIQESANENDELTVDTWDSYQAGRRIYPRIKRYVAEAWKKIQISRDEWEFKSEKYNGVVYPQFKFSNGGVAPPVAGDVFVGVESGLTVEVRSVTLTSGDWANGDAEGVVSFSYEGGSTNAVFGEQFDNDLTGDSFLYVEPAAYDFSLSTTDMATIQWTTMAGNEDGMAGVPIKLVPWDNWFYHSLDFAHGTRSVPTYVSQDPQGKAVFYPISLEPFNISFIYTTTPQILNEYDDEVTGLPEYLQEYIVWEAVKMLASYDKNNSLFAHANKEAVFYRGRIDKNEMPLISFSGSKFNE